jgi:DNA-binding HxlR family transcriptional regulator
MREQPLHWEYEKRIKELEKLNADGSVTIRTIDTDAYERVAKELRELNAELLVVLRAMVAWGKQPMCYASRRMPLRLLNPAEATIARAAKHK